MSRHDEEWSFGLSKTQNSFLGSGYHAERIAGMPDEAEAA